MLRGGLFVRLLGRGLARLRLVCGKDGLDRYILAGQAVQFAAASALWLAAMFVIAYLLLKERDVKA